MMSKALQSIIGFGYKFKVIRNIHIISCKVKTINVYPNSLRGSCEVSPTSSKREDGEGLLGRRMKRKGQGEGRDGGAHTQC